MATLPLFTGGLRVDSSGISTATSAGVSVTAGARAYGSYTELVAATPHEYQAITLTGSAAAVNRHVLTLAIGAAGSEVDIATDIPMHVPPTRRQVSVLTLPLNIPAGVRLSVKISRDSASTGAITLAVLGTQGGPGMPVGFQRARGYGVGAALLTSGVTTVTSSSTAHTVGNYAQLTSSTARKIKAISVALHSVFTSTSDALVNLAVGAASSEVNILTKLPLYTYSSTQETNMVVYGPFPCNLPSGVRLAANIQGSTASTTAAVSVIGFD